MGVRVLNRRRVLVNPVKPGYDPDRRPIGSYIGRSKTASGHLATRGGKTLAEALAKAQAHADKFKEDVVVLDQVRGGYSHGTQETEVARAYGWVPSPYYTGPPPTRAYNPADESVQDKSYREWRENFQRVSDDPESASVTDLRRAIGYLDHVRGRITRKAWEEGRTVDANVLASYDNEQDYYLSLIKKKGGR